MCNCVSCVAWELHAAVVVLVLHCRIQTREATWGAGKVSSSFWMSLCNPRGYVVQENVGQGGYCLLFSVTNPSGCYYESVFDPCKSYAESLIYGPWVIFSLCFDRFGPKLPEYTLYFHD